MTAGLMVHVIHKYTMHYSRLKLIDFLLPGAIHSDTTACVSIDSYMISHMIHSLGAFHR